MDKNRTGKHYARIPCVILIHCPTGFCSVQDKGEVNCTTHAHIFKEMATKSIPGYSIHVHVTTVSRLGPAATGLSLSPRRLCATTKPCTLLATGNTTSHTHQLYTTNPHDNHVTSTSFMHRMDTSHNVRNAQRPALEHENTPQRTTSAEANTNTVRTRATSNTLCGLRENEGSCLNASSANVPGNQDKETS